MTPNVSTTGSPNSPRAGRRMPPARARLAARRAPGTQQLLALLLEVLAGVAEPHRYQGVPAQRLRDLLERGEVYERDPRGHLVGKARGPAAIKLEYLVRPLEGGGGGAAGGGGGGGG